MEQRNSRHKKIFSILQIYSYSVSIYCICDVTTANTVASYIVDWWGHCSSKSGIIHVYWRCHYSWQMAVYIVYWWCHYSQQSGIIHRVLVMSHQLTKWHYILCTGDVTSADKVASYIVYWWYHFSWQSGIIHCVLVMSLQLTKWHHTLYTGDVT